MKPENVLVRCIAVASVLEFQISDFGNAQTTTTTVDGVPCSKTIAPRWVQSDVYRPFDLLGACSNVPLISRYDIWALGCIFWDVAHTPRLRSPGDGGHLRLASTYVSGDGAPDLERLWMARNGRVSKRLPRHLASIVNKMQPRDLSRRCQTNLVEVMQTCVDCRMSSLGCPALLYMLTVVAFAVAAPSFCAVVRVAEKA